MERSGNLLILAHAASWEARFQITSLAASEAAAGNAVDIALFFSALRSWATGRWDELNPAGDVSVESLQRLSLPELSTLFESGRRQGLIRFYACSASVRILGLDTGSVQNTVEAILGWQSFSRMIHRAHQVVSL